METIEAVLVTGAGRGIGRAIAERLGAAGFFVGCLSRSSRVQGVVDAIRAAGGQAAGLEVDLCDLRATEACVEEWAAGCGGATCFGAVLAAGELGPSGGLRDADLAAWGEVFRVNVLGNLAAVRGLLPRMMQRRFGRIVAFAGGGAAYAYPAFSAYALSKVAMVRAVENLHQECKDQGDIRVVALAPGAVETEMLQQVRAAGAEVRTTVAMDEPVTCVEQWIRNPGWDFSGRFVHVRDPWRDAISDRPESVPENQWMLRRIEPLRS